MNGEYRAGDVVLGNWTLTRLIGEGSYGKVWEARREDFGVSYTAAVKIITIPQSSSEITNAMSEGMDNESVTAYFRGFVEEIVQEFALMSRLKGTANVVSYEDHAVVPHEGRVGWDIIIRMELLTPLLNYTVEHTLTKRDVIRLGIDLCKALELCQKFNIVHRDIKPENIFVSELGDYKLGDFGIARTVEKTTGGLSKKGTYTYMAPEVYREQPYGPGVDIYSLGVVLYRLLNDNRAPFLPAYPAPITHSDREKALVRRISGEALPAPANADGRLAEIVLKACAFSPKDRYSSPMQMRQELEAILYSRAEAPVIYPGGDEAPQPETEYVTDRKEPRGETARTAPEKTESVFGDSASKDSTIEDRTEESAPEKTESVFTKTAPPHIPDAEPQKKPKKKRAALRISLAAAAAVLAAALVLSFYVQKDKTVNEDGTYTISEHHIFGKTTIEKYYDTDGTLTGWHTFEYDANGNKIEDTQYDADGTISSCDEYDANGNQVKYTQYNADGTISFWDTYEYDANGKKIKEMQYDADGTILSCNEYNANENKIKETQYDADGTVSSCDEYDAGGRKIKETHYHADGTINYWDTYEYDTRGNQVTDTSYDADGNMVKNAQYNADGTIWLCDEYDANGNKIKETQYNADETIYNWYTYEYDANGNLVKDTNYNADGTISSCVECDANGNKIKEIQYDADGTMIGWDIYEYDANGNKIKETWYDADGTPSSWNKYEYNAGGVISKVTKYDEYGMTTDKYDDAGNLMRETANGLDGSFVLDITNTYDSNGNLRKTISYNEDGTISDWFICDYDSNNNKIKQTNYDANGIVTGWNTYTRDNDGDTNQTYYTADGVVTYTAVYDHQSGKTHETYYGSDGETYEYWR